MNTTRHGEREFTQRLYRATIGLSSQAMRVATAALIVIGASGGSAPSRAQAIVGEELRLEELEQAFWVCDYAATINLVDIHDAIHCSRLTEALRQRKFEGDFTAMLAWWQQHKQAKHLELSKGSAPSFPRSAPSVPP